MVSVDSVSPDHCPIDLPWQMVVLCRVARR
jgi:hypothetical protein